MEATLHSQPRKIAAKPSSRVPPTMAFSAPMGLNRMPPAKPRGARPRAPSLDPPAFLLPPSPPVFSSVPKPMAKQDGDKSYRLAYISSSCPDVTNFIPSFAPVEETSEAPEVQEKARLSGSGMFGFPALGSSPTIISVLQTGSAPTGHRQSFGGHVPIRIQAVSPPQPERDLSPPSYGPDDDLMFGPLSLGADADFLGEDHVDQNQLDDQLGFLQL